MCTLAQIVKEHVGLSSRAQSSKLKAFITCELSALSFQLLEVSGFEPMTFPLEKRDALADCLTNPSSPIPLMLVEVNGFEPMTSCVQGRRSPS
jgi:hypothetical protein